MGSVDLLSHTHIRMHAHMYLYYNDGSCTHRVIFKSRDYMKVYLTGRMWRYCIVTLELGQRYYLPLISWGGRYEANSGK